MSLDLASAQVKLNLLTAIFRKQALAATPLYPELCTVVTSNGASEDYGMLGAMPGVREWLGERKFQQLRAARFNILNRLWENSLEIEKTDLDDDRMGLYGPLAQELADEGTYHPDELMIGDLVVGGTAKACFDGQFFFDTDHLWGESGTQSNLLTYNAAAGSSEPTPAEAKAAFNASRTKMMTYKTDTGKKLNRIRKRSMSQLALLVPPELEQIFADGLQATVNAAGATNVVIDAPRIIVSPELTDPLSFYTLNLGGTLKPFVFQMRAPMRRQIADLTNDKEKTVKFMTTARYSVGFLAWWAATKTTFN